MMPWKRSPGNEALECRGGWESTSDAVDPNQSPAAPIHSSGCSNVGRTNPPTLQLRPVSPAIGIEARGIDLSQPLSARAFDRLHSAWLETGLLIVRNQALSPSQQIAFTRRFGEILTYTRSENAHPDHPELLLLSNMLRDGRPCGSPASGRYWHSDGHFLRRPPSASLLFGVIVPPIGGDTWFANMTMAYDALPQETKDRIDRLRVIISRVRSRPYNYPDKPPVTAAERAAWPDMDQPMVRTHPETGRKALYVGGNVPWLVEKMEESESTPLVSGLQAHAVQERFVHIHRWRQGDLVIWDNRSTLHRATGYDQAGSRRHMHRTSVAGDLPV